MDTVIIKDNKKNNRKLLVPVGIVVLLLFAYIVKSVIGDATYAAEKDDLRTAEVMQGEFNLNVRSNGVLAVKLTHSVVSKVLGRVEAVYVKPGDSVDEGTVLVKLSNPELPQDIDKLKWQIQLVEAETASEAKQAESALLDQEAVVMSAGLALKGLELKLDAEMRLRQENRSSISEIDFLRSKFDVEEQKARLDIERKRFSKMKENIEQQKLVHQARKEQLKKDWERLQRQLDWLTVKATSRGLVQMIDLQLGQQLNIGDEVARVANSQELIAELNVQELQVLNVAVGQSVDVSTRQNVIHGVVSRIAPTVSNGMVQVDVELTGSLPAEARPDLSVEGTINIATLPNTLFVNRPTYAQRDSKMGVFRIKGDSLAERIQVEFGKSTASTIQIIAGLRPGDQIIVSDTSAFDHHDEIILK